MMMYYLKVILMILNTNWRVFLIKCLRFCCTQKTSQKQSVQYIHYTRSMAWILLLCVTVLKFNQNAQREMLGLPKCLISLLSRLGYCERKTWIAKIHKASGTRWVSHKINAMKCVLSKFGAYIAHIGIINGKYIY